MNSEEFRREFLESVRSSAEIYREFREVCFVNEAARQLEEAEEVRDFEPCRFEGMGARGRKLRVDGYCRDDADDTMTLVVALFHDSDETVSIGIAEVRKAFGMVRAFVEEAVDGKLTDGAIDESEPGFGLAMDLKEQRGRIERLRFYLVTDAELNMRAKDLPEEVIADFATEYHVWDIARFYAAHASATGREDLRVEFPEFGESLPCIRAGGAEGEYEAFLCTIGGETLARIYDRFGSRLLEGNVRSFLSSGRGVNKAIRVTIIRQPEMFFAFNNGISATAESVDVRRTAEGLRLVSADNLQIVNGGQTTASLAQAQRKDKADLSRVQVQMKLSVLRADRAASLIPEIAKCANSQNKISEADFFSNHQYHIRLEGFSRRVWAPAIGGAQYRTRWFYERARGQYLNEQSRMSKAERAQFQMQHPRAQVLVKTDIAKLENTWRCLPHKVSLGSQKNFKEFAEWIAKRWDEDETRFNEGYFRSVVSLAILFRSTERLVAEQTWYQKGYRANIVTYALAKLKGMIDRQGGGACLDLRRIWERQSVSPELTRQIQVIAKSVFEILTGERAKENVTEWAKMELCWKRVLEHDMQLSADVTSKLVPAEEVASDQKQAKREQVIENGIEVQARVVLVGGSAWAQMRAWGESRHLLSERDASLLEVAAQIPRRLPSERQSALILDIWRRLLEEGCPDF